MIERLRVRIPAGAAGEFSSAELTMCATLIWRPFHPRVTAVASKRPRSFCQKYGWQVTPKHAYTLDPSKSEWADYATVQAECGNLSGNELTRNWSGNSWLQSSQLAEPLWAYPGLKIGINLCELIATLRKKTKAHAGNELSNILPKSSYMRKKPPGVRLHLMWKAMAG